MKKTIYIVIMIAGTVLGFQPVFANLPSLNGASFAGITLLAVGAFLLHRSYDTTEYSST
jgi:hypothetical protein